MADVTPDAFALHKKRNGRAWMGRSHWDKLYADAYEFAIPQRRPGTPGRPKTQVERLFDMTAPVGMFHFAGQLQQDLFPPGKEPVLLAPGPIPKIAVARGKLDPRAIGVLEKELQQTSALINPFFATGEWDQAVHETCLDLGVGTGALYIAKGTRSNPIRFVSIPSDDVAVETDLFGDVIGVFWKQHLARQAIHESFKEQNPTWPEDWASKLTTTGDEQIPLFQDFVREESGRWKFVAYIETSRTWIVENSFRARPIATPRYYRVPGEAYGRGPILLAMPSIKTLNKAQELALKAAAIQMLGIWGYRAGGTFNPDTVRVGPGEFWPMMATGGVLGPDVQRLDPASGRLDVARMVIGHLQDQIKATLLDNRIPPLDGTPESASAIVARLRQKKDAHLGAFGRLTREIMPVVVPRVIEILFDFGWLAQNIPIDELLVSIEVLSPMAQALKADRLSPIITYAEIIGALAGPEAMPLFLHMEKVLDLIASETHVPQDLRPTLDERETIKKDMQEKAATEQALALAAKDAELSNEPNGAAPALPMAA